MFPRPGDMGRFFWCVIPQHNYESEHDYWSDWTEFVGRLAGVGGGVFKFKFRE